MNHSPHLLPKIRSKLIMDQMQHYPCTLRISSFYPGYRCSAQDTNVGAHLGNLGKGTSTKVSDIAVACACERCHAIADRIDRVRYEYIYENYPVAMMHRFVIGLNETHAMLLRDGLIVVPDGVLI